VFAETEFIGVAFGSTRIPKLHCRKRTQRAQGKERRSNFKRNKLTALLLSYQPSFLCVLCVLSRPTSVFRFNSMPTRIHPLEFLVPDGLVAAPAGWRGSAVDFHAGTRHPQTRLTMAGQAGADAGSIQTGRNPCDGGKICKGTEFLTRISRIDTNRNALKALRKLARRWCASIYTGSASHKIYSFARGSGRR
jgi:hypothetical protein